jgi:hypothetical protein
MFSAPFLSTLLDRVKAIVRRVARPVAERRRLAPSAAMAPLQAERATPPGLCGLAQHWMSAKVRALSALMRRIEAGEVLSPPAAVARKAGTNGADAPAARTSVPAEKRLPRGFGWMCAFGPHVRRDGMAFAALLNEPAMRAKVLAAPERMARLIGPMLSATGELRPDWFPVVAKRTRATPVVPGPIDDAAAPPPMVGMAPVAPVGRSGPSCGGGPVSRTVPAGMRHGPMRPVRSHGAGETDDRVFLKTETNRSVDTRVQIVTIS